MNMFFEFEGRIEPMEWGDSTYTILRLPEDVSAALIAEGARRVEGEIGDHPVNLAINKAPVLEGAFLYTGKSFLDESGLAPGEVLPVRLREANPNVVETPPDVTAALHAAGKSAQWAALTPGKQRGMLYQIKNAKRAETRAKRIQKLITELE